MFCQYSYNNIKLELSKNQYPSVDIVFLCTPRLLRNLYTIEGGGQTDVLVVVDGAHQETLALASVMGVAALIHRPEGVLSNRTNANIRFALYSVFRHFPRADKAILLEDDLLLSPDFLRSD